MPNSKSLFSPITFDGRVTKVLLYNLDGTTSQIKVQLPIFSMWSEPQERLSIYLRQFVMDLTRDWIQIYAFEIEEGTTKKGKENYTCKYMPKMIPEGKVFIPGRLGQWVDPAEVKDAEATMRKSKVDGSVSTMLPISKILEN